MAQLVIKNATGKVTITIDGEFWPGCGPKEWSISDEAMRAVLRGFMAHHDRALAELSHWHTHGLASAHSVARADFGDAIGQAMCAAQSFEKSAT